MYRGDVVVIEQARRYIESQTGLRPRIAVVLGSGLGAFADELSDAVSIPYSAIPGWPQSTAAGHSGRLAIGKLDSLEVAVLAGRVHLYEGYSPAQVTFGVHVLGALGIRSIILTNAAGGIGEHLWQRGGLVIISDHINLQGSNPLAGPSSGFPDMTEAYSKQYRKIAREVGGELDMPMREGVYAAMLGPSYETPAEIRYLRAIGADLVGMSTVPEVIVANKLGIGVLGISCVTNPAAGILDGKLDHKDVLKAAEKARDTLVRFLKAVIPRIAALNE